MSRDSTPPPFSGASFFAEKKRRGAAAFSVLRRLPVYSFAFPMRDRRAYFAERPFWMRAAVSVLRMSMAMVIGPTPPGTGVMALHFGATFA